MARTLAQNLERLLRERLDLKNLKKRDLDYLSRSLIFEMKHSISRGISPISGRRFPRYKNPSSYPGDRKPHTPVNLELSGEFLDNLSYRVFTGPRPRIQLGFFDRESVLKEKGHREGANGQPKRPIIPLGRENFSKRILENFDKSIERVFGSLT